MDNKKKRIIWQILKGLIILGCLYYLITGVFRLFMDASLAMQERLPNSQKMLSEYKHLFNPKLESKLSLTTTFNSTKRNPISLLKYQNKYDIFVYEIDSVYSHSLDETLLYQKKQTMRSTDVGYLFADAGRADNFYNISYISDDVPKIQKLFLIFDADSVKTVLMNDRMALFYLDFRRVSIRYSKDAKNDMLISVKKNLIKGETLPLDLLFLRNKGALYLVTMSVKKEGEVLPPSKLLELIK